MDDILLSGNNVAKLQAVKNFLHGEFTIKDLGEADYFLGIQILHANEGIWISQQKYICDILQETNMAEAKPIDTPFLQGAKSCNLKALLYQILTNIGGLLGAYYTSRFLGRT